MGYGDKGYFWVQGEDLEKEIDTYGCFVNIDMDADALKWLRDNQGKVIKKKSDNKVYLIQGDKKRWYVDGPTLVAHGKRELDITIISDDIFDKISEGENILFWDGNNLAQVQEMYRYFKEGNPAALKQFVKYLGELK